MTVRFRRQMDIIGVNPYVLVLPAEADSIKPGKRSHIPVVFRVNGKESPWRVNLVPIGDGRFRLYLNGEIREKMELEVGDLLELDVEFDRDYKGGPPRALPAWFTAALHGNPKAKQGWRVLRPSLQKEMIRYLARLKSAKVRERNLELAVLVLSGGEARFLGRSWNQQAASPQRRNSLIKRA